MNAQRRSVLRLSALLGILPLAVYMAIEWISVNDSDFVEIDGHRKAAGSVYGTVSARYLNCRSCPRTDCKIEDVYKNGKVAKLICAASRHTTTVHGNPWWDKTSDGCWVSEDWMFFRGYFPPTCDEKA